MTFAFLTASCHFAISRWMKAPNSLPFIGVTTVPISARRLRTSGCATVSASAFSSLPMTGGGVLAGAMRPSQYAASVG